MTNNKNRNFLFVGLANDYVRKFAVKFCEKLGLYFLDIEKLIDYTLIDKIKMEKLCGVEYLSKQEENIVKGINEYENVVALINYSTFVKYGNLIKAECLKIYLNLNINDIKNFEHKTDINSELNEIIFKERDKYLKKNCDIILNCDIINMESQVNKFIEGLNCEN